MRSPSGQRWDAARLAGRMPPLVVAALRVAETVAPGVHGRRRSGQGYAFWQYRHYQPGDPVRLIDWRRSARGDPVFVREREAEVAQNLWLWADRSPSMAFASRDGLPTKRERADLLLLALAVLLLDRMSGAEQVHLLGGDRRPFSGPDALARLAGALERMPAGADGLPAIEGLPRHAQIVLIGDFFEPIETLAERLHAFAAIPLRGHLLQIVDPAEEGLPMRGRTLFEGTESEGELLIRNVDGVRSEYVRRFAAHREALRAIAARLGWTFDVHRTDRPASAALLALHTALSLPV